MKKKYILKSNREFNRIIETKKPVSDKYYVIYVDNDVNDSQLFGFSVGKKIGNAVERNKLRRQLKSIVQSLTYKGNFKCVIITKKQINSLSYNEKRKRLIYLLGKTGIIEYEE